MGKYSVPAEIRAMKPKGTMVKTISGRYYVYEYRTVREGSRKRTEMGRCTGSITARGGFAPNSGMLRNEEVTCLTWASEPSRLRSAARPGRCCCVSTSTCATPTGCTRSRRLGRASAGNDLAAKGSKFRLTGEHQMNLLVALDANTGAPLLSRFHGGGAVDSVSVRDLLAQAPFRGVVFLVDRGFYSAENLRLFTSNGRQYVIPLARGPAACRSAVSSLEMEGRFMHERGRKASVVERHDDRSAGARVLVFRDASEAAAMQANYLRRVGRGDGSYTMESFAEESPHMGVTVLQTSLEDRPPEEVYHPHKKRWAAGTHFDRLKNGQGFEDLGQQGYRRAQGLAFVMLVSSLVDLDMSRAVGASGVGMPVNDVLMEAKMVKTCRRDGVWVAVNCKKKRMEMLSRLGVDPAEFLKPLPAT